MRDRRISGGEQREFGYFLASAGVDGAAFSAFLAAQYARIAWICLSLPGDGFFRVLPLRAAVFLDEGFDAFASSLPFGRAHRAR